MKRLIVVADDFGLCSAVNEAVVRAHTQGILTAASLMMAEEATLEAIELARKYPSLKVGLHLALIHAKSVLPHETIPHLTDSAGHFSNQLIMNSIRLFFSPVRRRELFAECEAQIQAFLKTGLPCDHLNVHNHLHTHPTILSAVLKLAKKYNIRAIRWPFQKRPCRPDIPIPFTARISAWVMAPWLFRMKKLFKKEGIVSNDHLFGLFETGRLQEEDLLALTSQLEEGVTEVYCHPATETTGVLLKQMPHYAHALELEALLSKKLSETLNQRGVLRIGYSDLAGLQHKA